MLTNHQFFKYKYEGLDDTVYGGIERTDVKGRNSSSMYDPPLPTSILKFRSENVKQKGKHTTQKPATMMNWILKYYSKECDVILDPTMGSGSMGVACKKTNIKCIGIEIDEEIYKFACDRLSDDLNLLYLFTNIVMTMMILITK